MEQIHGGDIYRNRIELDFSVNTNPLGMPDSVQTALMQAICACRHYPDIHSEKLSLAVSQKLSVPAEWLLFGNGASELFMAVVHAIKPRKVWIPVPSFYGYEHVCHAVGSESLFYPLMRENDFAFQEKDIDALPMDVDMVFLANPNNPTGKRLDRSLGMQLLRTCKKQNTVVVMDECFVEFLGEDASFLSELRNYGNLIIVRAFTKIYAIPGVRLGYLLCGDDILRDRIRAQLPEWNLSTFAQAAGIAAAEECEYVKDTVSFVRRQRHFLKEELEKMGLQVIAGEANYLLAYSSCPLYDRLLKKKILIRDCSNFRGLEEGYIRIAIRQGPENERLLKAIGECIEEDRTIAAGRN